MANAEVRESKICAGTDHPLGLFAAGKLAKDVVIAQFEFPLDRTQAEVEFEGYRHDSGVFLGKGFVWDHGFTSGRTPLWWRMNHQPAKLANVKLVNGAHNTPTWRTLRKVAIDEELTYDYGDVPSEWA